MINDRYLTHVVESQAQTDVNGFRCWSCYQKIGNLHAANCFAPFRTAGEQFLNAWIEALEIAGKSVNTLLRTIRKSGSQLRERSHGQ